jgi:putative membrane protein
VALSNWKMSACALIFSATMAGVASAATLTPADYAKKAAEGDMFEIQSSQLALEKSTNDAVKAFAKMMVDDHKNSSAKLTAAAERDNFAISPPKDLDQTHQNQMDDMKSKSGAAFDKVYVEDQLKAHESALALHKEFASSGDQPAMKAAAAEISGVVTQHLDHLRKLNAAVR